MNFTEVKLYTTTEGIEPVTAVLMQLGVTGFVIEDAKDFESFLTDTQPYWDYIDDDLMKLKECETSITIYLAENSQGAETLTAIKTAMAQLKAGNAEGAYGRLEIELGNVKEEDWANNWKQFFKPLEVGERFVIKPSWEEYNKGGERMILEIDPSSSFGTGSHHTTQLCLEQLEKQVKQGDNVLDMGCGSGILSVAALMLGAKHVTAVDIDLNSIKITGENMALNNFANDKYTALCGNVISDSELAARLGSGCYDVIAANIVADVIAGMSGLFPRYLKEGGVLVCSGIINNRAEEIADLLKQSGLEIVSISEKEDWTAITAVKG